MREVEAGLLLFGGIQCTCSVYMTGREIKRVVFEIRIDCMSVVAAFSCYVQ